MKPHPRGTELKVGTSRSFTQPVAETESDAELDKPSEDSGVPAPDDAASSVPTTGAPKDL
jgi:hypothetical protein